jgi:hypothetical protein
LVVLPGPDLPARDYEIGPTLEGEEFRYPIDVQIELAKPPVLPSDLEDPYDEDQADDDDREDEDEAAGAVVEEYEHFPLDVGDVLLDEQNQAYIFTPEQQWALTKATIRMRKGDAAAVR